MITVSIVSHYHGEMIGSLLDDLANCPQVAKVILTMNVPEAEIVLPPTAAFRTLVLRNAIPKGFASNHNAAFEYCDTPFFCVLNPDVRLSYGNPFPILIECLRDNIALCAPAVISPSGEIEDSARLFPDIFTLVAKLLGGDDGRYRYEVVEKTFWPEWVAGMFMLFTSAGFAAVNGFDESFFLYYEDVDLCVRMWRSGSAIALCPQAKVLHDARRASRRNPLHMVWHASSMVRFFFKHWGRLPAVPKTKSAAT